MGSGDESLTHTGGVPVVQLLVQRRRRGQDAGGGSHHGLRVSQSWEASPRAHWSLIAYPHWIDRVICRVVAWRLRMSILKRPSKRDGFVYVVRLRAPDGRTFNKTFRTKTLARQWETDQRSQMSRGVGFTLAEPIRSSMRSPRAGSPQIRRSARAGLRETRRLFVCTWCPRSAVTALEASNLVMCRHSSTNGQALAKRRARCVVNTACLERSSTWR